MANNFQRRPPLRQSMFIRVIYPIWIMWKVSATCYKTKINP